MAAEKARRTLSENDVLREVRWRFRICQYLFVLAFAWMLTGEAFTLYLSSRGSGSVDDATWLGVELIGFGIFSAAFVLTLAIYRCPVCDKYLSNFRPSKELCPSCGAKVQAPKQNNRKHAPIP